MTNASNWRLEVKVEAEFEECLEFSWMLRPRTPGLEESGRPPHLKSSIVEMVLDREKDTTATAPHKDAMVKKVDMGGDTRASLQNMPEGRRFFIAVAGVLPTGVRLRSPWVRAATLDPAARQKDLGNRDPLNRPRLHCNKCPCPGFIAITWNQFVSADQLRCRRCGCSYEWHEIVDIADILKIREDKACQRLQRQKVTQLPPEALGWDDREDDLWFLTEGAMHPRKSTGEGRAPPKQESGPGGPQGLDGRKGRVSVVTPTTESRRKFHESLWTCFAAQKREDKELVVVETYFEKYSDFFEKKAKADSRLIYIKFKRPKDADWSIGLKRNIGAHLATGEFIANFDDDDLYAPTYLDIMVGELERRRAQAVTLSSWFVVDAKTNQWSFCDPVAWGAAKGLKVDAPKVRTWAYGYGFSYLNRRRASLEHPYEDRNMGEDFCFITRLQHTMAEESVQLVHDDFGICLHTQHGENTSETFPIRKVSHEEASELDVAELALVAPLLRYDAAGEPASASRGSGRRRQQLTAYTPLGEVSVSCPLGSTVDEFLECMKQEIGLSMAGCKVHRVPTARHAAEAEREERAVDLLGVASVLEEAVREADASAQDLALARQLVLQRVKHAMRGAARIPLRTKELWLARPGEGAEAEEPDEVREAEAAPDEPLFTVEVTCQTAKAKKYFASSRTFKVMLPHGSDTRYLKDVLGADMPPTARVLIEGREHPLQETEKVPGKITLTEFNGKRKLYVRFSRSQCAQVLETIREYFDKPEVQVKLDEMDKQSGEDENRQMKHSMHLSELLMTEVYPLVLRKYQIPCTKVDGLGLVPRALVEVGMHLELLELQYKAEYRMRNWGTVQSLTYTIAQKRQELGLPQGSL